MVIYDDDDPWNQTAADNAEWLIRFKRDVGLAAIENGPGLEYSETSNTSWRCEKGGTGFSPPYVFPKEPPTMSNEDVTIRMNGREFEISAQTAAHFAKNVNTRYQPPGQIFCSRELESGLNVFVKSQIAKGHVPTDEIIRAKAREILGMNKTSADDLDLLEKFKAFHGLSNGITPLTDDHYPIIDDAMAAEFDKEIENIDLNDPTIFPMTTGTNGISMTAPFHEMSTFDTIMFDQQPQPDYADLHRLSAATSSPLRRRASEKLAQQAGYINPILHPTPRVPVAVLANERVQRTQGSGEISVDEWERWGRLVDGEGGSTF